MPDTLPIIDHESLKLCLLEFIRTPKADEAMALVDQIMGASEPIPAQVFDLINPAGRAAALMSWIGYHMENPTAETFNLPGSGREW